MNILSSFAFSIILIFSFLTHADSLSVEEIKVDLKSFNKQVKKLSKWGTGVVDFDRVKYKDFSNTLIIGLDLINNISHSEDMSDSKKEKLNSSIRHSMAQVFMNLTAPYEDAAVTNIKLQQLKANGKRHEYIFQRVIMSVLGLARDVKTTLPWDSTVTKDAGTLWWSHKIVPRVFPFIGSDTLRSAAVTKLSSSLKTLYTKAVESSEPNSLMLANEIKALISQLENSEPLKFSVQNKFIVGVWVSIGIWFGVLNQWELSWYRTSYSGVTTLMEWLAISSYMIRARYVNSGLSFKQTVMAINKIEKTNAAKLSEANSCPSYFRGK